MKPEHLSLVLARRKANNESIELKAKREAWLNNLSILAETLEYDKVQQRYGKGVNIFITKKDILVTEIYPCESEDEGSIHATLQILDSLHNPYWNTRTKMQCETCLEIDKLTFEQAHAIICETCLALIKRNIHFAVFYCEGARSEHIRIYDWNDLKILEPYQREIAQAQFWRSVMPFGTFQYADAGMWQDEHFYCLEFALHWKHNTPFDLLFEYIPESKPIIKKENEIVYIEQNKKEPTIRKCDKHPFVDLLLNQFQELCCAACQDEARRENATS